MTVGSVGDAGTDGAGRRTFDGAARLTSIRDRETSPSRVTVFDPRPARLDEAWIAVEAGAVVSLRAMR